MTIQRVRTIKRSSPRGFESGFKPNWPDKLKKIGTPPVCTSSYGEWRSYERKDLPSVSGLPPAGAQIVRGDTHDLFAVRFSVASMGVNRLLGVVAIKGTLLALEDIGLHDSVVYPLEAGGEYYASFFSPNLPSRDTLIVDGKPELFELAEDRLQFKRLITSTRTEVWTRIVFGDYDIPDREVELILRIQRGGAVCFFEFVPDRSLKVYFYPGQAPTAPQEFLHQFATKME